MKKIITIIFVLAVTGCSKEFLAVTNPNQIADGNFWLNSHDAYFGINGVYQSLANSQLYGGGLNQNAGLPMYDCLGDNGFNYWDYEGLGYFMTSNIDPSNTFFSGFWSACYAGIGRANNAILNLSKMPVSAIDDSTKNNLIGQARFLRALNYINLAVYFQDVPLITTVQSLAESYVPKNTYQEVSAQIIQDLKYAADVLPVAYPANQSGYATKGAALGLLARISLYNKNYQGVLDATNTLLTLGYSLNASYPALFTQSGENSKEILFQVRFGTAANDNKETFSCTYSNAPKVDEQPMPNLANDYYCTDGKPITTSPLYKPATPKLNRDPRCSATIYFKNDVFITDLGSIFTGTGNSTGYGLKKYINTTGTTYSATGQDFYVVRYADVLLMRAEALVELNQPSEVYTLVNQVRARVSMPTVNAVEGANLSQDELRKVVRHERRVELAFEGLRFYDLKRWGTVQQAFQAAIADNVPGYQIIYRNGKSQVFPIPQSELSANASLIQNPIWQ